MHPEPPDSIRRPSRRPARAQRRGFTLIELLTVISILAILLAMTLAVIGYAQNKSAEERTRTTHAAIVAGLKKYYDKYGEYPEPATNTGTGLGGAMCLYQALNDDGDDQIVGGTGTSSIGEAGENRIFDLVSDGNVAKDGSKYFVKDGFDRPFYYRVYDPDNPEATNNKTFDLWSFGDDKAKEEEARWIKNW